MLVTVVGEPGIGKSRLVARVRRRSTATPALVGRCPPYGEAVTYHPLAEVVRGSRRRRRRVPARARRRRSPGRPASQEPSGSPARPDRARRPQWAARRLFEALAAERPLVLALDDVHWAEPTFLDLVEYVVGFSRSAPILIVCLARPDLLRAGRRGRPRAGTRASSRSSRSPRTTRRRSSTASRRGRRRRPGGRCSRPPRATRSSSSRCSPSSRSRGGPCAGSRLP